MDNHFITFILARIFAYMDNSKGHVFDFLIDILRFANKPANILFIIILLNYLFLQMYSILPIVKQKNIYISVINNV